MMRAALVRKFLINLINHSRNVLTRDGEFPPSLELLEQDKVKIELDIFFRD